MPAVESAHTCTTQIKQGEFWTAKQRYGHSIHEISYRACYKPQLPAYFIKRYAEPGQLIYDPFMGRGTTLIEAKLLGCNVIGNDVNPLSTILTAPRLCEQNVEKIAQRIAQITLRDVGIEDKDLPVLMQEQPHAADEHRPSSSVLGHVAAHVTSLSSLKMSSEAGLVAKFS